MASEKSACDDLHAFLPADATSLDSKLRAPNSKQAFQHIEALCLGVAVVAAEHPDQFAKNLMDDHQIDLANGPFQGFLGQPRLSRVIVGHQSDHHIRVDCDHGFLRRLVPASPAAAAAWATASFTSSVVRARAGRGRIPRSAANDGSCARATRADPSGCGSNTMRSHSPTPNSRRKSFGNVI